MKTRVILKYFQDDCRFNGVYPRDNLPNKRKDGVYPINLDEWPDIGWVIGLLCMHWIMLLNLIDL